MVIFANTFPIGEESCGSGKKRDDLDQYAAALVRVASCTNGQFRSS
jgi:hypothetical protein